MTNKTKDAYLEDEQCMRKILIQIYNALQEKGYDPINQIIGYIISGDPTYITTHKNARNLMQKINRDAFLQVILKIYLME